MVLVVHGWLWDIGQLLLFFDNFVLYLTFLGLFRFDGASELTGFLRPRLFKSSFGFGLGEYLLLLFLDWVFLLLFLDWFLVALLLFFLRQLEAFDI